MSLSEQEACCENLLLLDVTAEASVPSSDSDFDLPPPPEDFPPPPSLEDIRLAQGKPAPPPLSTKPKLKSSQERPSVPAKPIERRGSDNDVKSRLPPPVIPKRVGSNSSLRSNDSNHQPSLPPLPPPPPDGSFAPLSNYYIGGDSGGNYSVDEFPPPPPFISDLKVRGVVKRISMFIFLRKHCKQTFMACFLVQILSCLGVRLLCNEI